MLKVSKWFYLAIKQFFSKNQIQRYSEETEDLSWDINWLSSSGRYNTLYRKEATQGHVNCGVVYLKSSYKIRKSPSPFIANHKM